MKNAYFSMRDTIASTCRDDFYFFVQEMWETLIAETPVYNWHIPALCNELQELAERIFAGDEKVYDLLINIPPGTTKSTICSIMFPAWCWTRMPSLRYLTGSYTYGLALEHSRKSRDLIISEKYTELFPEVNIRDDQNTKGHYETTQKGKRYAVGTGGSVIGMHGHINGIDDPIDPQAATSDTDLNRISQWCLETFSQRKVDKRISVMILIMQRLAENDPSGVWLEKAKNNEIAIRHICLPAEEEGNHVSPPEFRAHYINGLLDPIRLSTKVLTRERSTLGPYGYAGQYDQNPIPRKGAMFDVAQIQVIRGVNMMRFRRLVRYWDKAGTHGGGAFTVGALLGELMVDGLPQYWILDIVRGQWNTGERERMIEATAARDGKRVRVGVEQEPGSGGKESAENTVRRLSGYRVSVDPVKGNKTLRADPFSSQVNVGNVYMLEAEWNNAFIGELRFFPNSKYKDQVDATSGAYAMLAAPRRRITTLSQLASE